MPSGDENCSVGGEEYDSFSSDLEDAAVVLDCPGMALRSHTATAAVTASPPISLKRGAKLGSKRKD